MSMRDAAQAPPNQEAKNTVTRLPSLAVLESIPKVSSSNLLDDLVTNCFPLQPKKAAVQNAIWLAQPRSRFGRPAL